MVYTLPKEGLRLFLLKTMAALTVKIMKLFNEAGYSSTFPFPSVLLLGRKAPRMPSRVMRLPFRNLNRLRRSAPTKESQR